ncbi:molybdopterin molybdotransferase MoeA [Sphingobacterium suaedae]|uniref:Molybdopterin molybdenumtransferase n=1 Tax=Sphingobacterium suaedae TaxID=1686402 RepID=A0ABW5KHB2_9SPHI
MTTVTEAEALILAEKRDYGTERIAYEQALGRVLAEDLRADRDLPPYDRATVDGVALDSRGLTGQTAVFRMIGTQAAGDNPIPIKTNTECVEIMTGAALHESVNTVVRYEDLDIVDDTVQVKLNTFRYGHNIHKKGTDKRAGDIVVHAHQTISPEIVGIAATLGSTQILVKKVPRVCVLTTGDELVPPEEKPTPFQIRRSNGVTVAAVLKSYGIRPILIHMPDLYEEMEQILAHALENYDVILLTGGVSMGKFDFVPRALRILGVQKKFHKVRQRPGKPFCFGTFKNNALIFAFPGNPVSVFMCLHRYFIPWLRTSMGLPILQYHAVLQQHIHFSPSLQYFAQVQLATNTDGQLTANFIETNGSGDFSHLAETQAFIELPLERSDFHPGEVFRIWPYSLYL